MPDRDPVPALAREVIDLYRGPLEAVRFPDLDRDVLDAAEVELLEAQRALEEAERALERAREQVAEHGATLVSKAQRALAYARVFAEGQPELRERLDAIAAPASKRGELAREPSSASAPRRSRRGRKNGGDDGATLFEAPTPADADADADDAITDAA
ncbi:MAG: hypothetical protein M3Y87_11835 [Myxococcota bacterium]|nr:hypothetical protein [Myxococcota bacterium]